MQFLKASMDHAHVCAALQSGLQSRRLRHSDVLSISVDDCSVNIKAHREIEEAMTVKWLLNLCLLHCTNNGGELATFPTLASLWALLQKHFVTDNAKTIWQQTTGAAWKTYADNRWFSRYDVMEELSKKFPDLERVLDILMANNYSPTNAGKLAMLISRHETCWYVKIELSAYVECLYQFRNFCYAMEGDGDLIFSCGNRIDQLFDSYDNDSLPSMPSTEALIKKALEWTVEMGMIRPIVPAERLTVADVVAVVVGPCPRRTAAVAAVRQATFVGETAAQRGRREDRESSSRRSSKRNT
jgi:hypothetical protein